MLSSFPWALRRRAGAALISRVSRVCARGQAAFGGFPGGWLGPASEQLSTAEHAVCAGRAEAASAQALWPVPGGAQHPGARGSAVLRPAQRSRRVGLHRLPALDSSREGLRKPRRAEDVGSARQPPPEPGARRFPGAQRAEDVGSVQQPIPEPPSDLQGRGSGMQDVIRRRSAVKRQKKACRACLGGSLSFGTGSLTGPRAPSFLSKLPAASASSSVWLFVGNGGMGCGDYYRGFYRDDFRDSFPHSLLSTRQPTKNPKPLQCNPYCNPYSTTL